MTKRKILLQLDTDAHPSSFDAVVATDGGADVLLQYSGITPDNVEPLVHGAMFTRGPGDLKNTAIFIGGSDVAAGEAVFERVLKCFFGPMRVSTMIDSNGCNTTAAAAVVRAAEHLDLSSTTASVLAGTGPVGRRVARLLAGAGASVRLVSRSLDRAQAACDTIRQQLGNVGQLEAADSTEAINGCEAVFACGAAGVQLCDAKTLASSGVKLAIDLNAVPPVGIEGIDLMDRAKQVNQQICYGAIGVGGTKMKIHLAAIESLFVGNDKALDAESIYAIGQDLK